MNIYGAVVTANDVRDAVLGTMKQWTPFYVAEVAVQNDRPRCGDESLPRFRSFGGASSFSTFPEDQLPAMVVVVPGLGAKPVRQGDGMYLAKWSVGLGVVVSGRDRDSTDELLRLYIAAARTTAVQQNTMGGFAEDTEWIDEDYDDQDYDSSRTIAAGMVSLNVTVADVVNAYGGPRSLPDDPCADPGNYGIVLSTPLQTKEAQG